VGEAQGLLAVRRGGALGEVGEGTGAFGRADATKSQLAISIISATTRLRSKVDTKGLCKDGMGEYLGMFGPGLRAFSLLFIPML
jgi:hypothetical protein